MQYNFQEILPRAGDGYNALFRDEKNNSIILSISRTLAAVWNLNGADIENNLEKFFIDYGPLLIHYNINNLDKEKNSITITTYTNGINNDGKGEKTLKEYLQWLKEKEEDDKMIGFKLKE